MEEEDSPQKLTIQHNNILVTQAIEAKFSGNGFFHKLDFEQATIAYTRGLQFLERIDIDKQENRIDATAILSENDASSSADMEAIACATLTELQLQLYSNRAMSCIKLGQYQQAEQDCTFLIDKYSVVLQQFPAKIWYRRAQARHELGRRQASESLLSQAEDDLRHCVERQSKKNASETHKELRQLSQRIQSEMEKLRRGNNLERREKVKQEVKRSTPKQRNQILQQSHVNKNSMGTNNHDKRPFLQYTSTSTILSPIPSPPSLREQKQDIIRLLHNRHGIGIHNVNPGEALFVVDWNWWCEWCANVGIFCETDKKANQVLLDCLPPGAVLPDRDDDDTNDEDMEEVHAVTKPPSPGMIDNAALLLPPLHPSLKKSDSTQNVFFNQWYQAYHDPSSLLSDVQDFSSLLALKPGLVRGHHYELLPREVYNALRLWYGELTPPILRRVNITGTSLKLHPLYSMSFRGSSEADQHWWCSTCGAPVLSMRRCSMCRTVSYCNRTCQERHWKYHKVDCKIQRQHGPAEQLQTEDSKSSDAALLSMARRRNNGRTGLNNLGNTCFMNSAIQCMSHTTPLTRLFLSGKFVRDLNPHNPLASAGNCQLALSYEQVLMDLWHCLEPSCTPSSLKRSISTLAPRFAGCLQHDAQEFLAYLLDGLHEDLNRSRTKPYIADADYDDGDALAAIRAWELHRLRNDSFVYDTVYGQFKSKCVCPQCERVSVSFDVFNHISLELPTPRLPAPPLAVILYLGGQHTTTRYAVPRTGRVHDAKAALSKLCNIPVQLLHLCDVVDGNVQNIYSDHKPVVSLSDEVVAYSFLRESNSLIVRAAHRAEGVVSHKGIVDTDNENDLFFGIPFLSAFSKNVTCREFCNSIWNSVCDFVEGEKAKTFMQIRLVDQDGAPIPFIGISGDDTGGNIVEKEEKKEGHTTKSAAASIIPSESNLLLSQLVGETACETIIFVHLEWLKEPVEVVDTEVERAGSCINVDSFMRFQDHSSWLQAEQDYVAKLSSARKGVTLDQCFEAFTKPERLDEQNTWYCSTCKNHVRALKTMEPWKLPNVMIIALKRFEFRHALRREKLDTMVDFPLEGLDMDKYCPSRLIPSFVDDHVPAIYDCFGVINHYGRLGFGHYTSFARQWDEYAMSKEWFLFDDSMVRQVVTPQSSVVTNAAYVLFYRRRTFA